MPRTKKRAASTLVAWGVVLAACFASGCAGKGVPTAVSPAALTADEIDADPLALLPPSAAIVATVDAHAFYASGTVGAQVAALSEKLLPLGEEAGFKASRDVDKVFAGTYTAAGVDVAAVVTGRFDEAAIDRAAEAHTQTHGGGVLAKSSYAGRSVYTVSDVGFTILTPKTALAGTQTGIRRALDRIRDGRPKREIPAWIQETIDTPDAAATLCADFTQPIPAAATAAIGSLPFALAKGADRVRLVAAFQPPGIHASGVVTYADSASATAGATALQQAATMANLVALTGLIPRIDDLDLRVDDTKVHCAFGLDERALRSLVSLATKYAR